MTKSLARELGSRNITVNCVRRIHRHGHDTGISEAQRSALLAQIPLGRWAPAADVAARWRTFASPAGGYVTGTVLHVNGGMYMS